MCNTVMTAVLYYILEIHKEDLIKSHHTQGHIYNYVEMDMLFIA